MKDILVLVASGFEDTELITAINVFKRNNISYDLVSVENLEQVQGQNIAIVPSTKIDDIDDLFSYQVLFLPGGKGHKVLLNDSQVIQVVQSYHSNHKIIAAICAAPEILKKANILGSKTYTSFPGFASGDHNTGQLIEIDGHIITGRDYEAALAFAMAVVEKIKQP